MIGKKVTYTIGGSNELGIGIILDKCIRNDSTFYLIKNDNDEINILYFENIVKIEEDFFHDLNPTIEKLVNENISLQDEIEKLKKEIINIKFNKLEKKYGL